MTDTKKPTTLDTIRTWLSQTKTEVMIVALAAIAVAAFIWAPETRWGALGHFVESIIDNPAGAIGGASSIGAAIGAFIWALNRPPGGSGGAAALLLALTLASSTLGCGASALTAQARAATIVGIGLGGAGAAIHEQRAAALDACDGDGLAALDCETQATDAWAPVVVAYESARAALTTWIGSLSVAQAAGADDGVVVAALLVAVMRLARGWNALAEALRGVGVPLPDLPESVVALMGGAT